MRAGATMAVAAALALASPAGATTYAPITKPDPFASGQTCTSYELGSWGSYIYDAPSKYDLVFEPQTEPLWISRCPSSGYISFADDFATLSREEHARIAAFLRTTTYRPKAADGEREMSDDLLRHLEAVYALRDKDAKFRAYFMRYLAWQYGAKPIADDYRRKAFQLHNAMPQGRWLKTQDELETLYILGFYAFKFGRTGEAKAQFRALDDAWTLDRSAASYLRALAKDVLAGKADDKLRFAELGERN